MQDKPKAMKILIGAIVVIFIAVVALGAYLIGARRGAPPIGNEIPPANATNAVAQPGTEALPPETSTDTDKAAVAPTKPTTGPNLDTVEDDLIAAAKAWKPGWHFEVDGHRRDWVEASVYGGPTAGKHQSVVNFTWDGKRFAFASEAPMPGSPATSAKQPAASGGELTEADLAGIPEEFRPSEGVALEAALNDNDDWAGKVQAHSKDWATATVLIGPKNSAYAAEVHLKWSVKGGYYDEVKRKPLHGQ